jgi:Cu2+-exporting ATPase
MQKAAERLAGEGKTPLFFAKNGRALGVIAVADTIKEDSPVAIRQLQAMGIRVVMLTGDNERTAQAVGKQAGVDEVIAGVLPEGKEQVIQRLKKQGKVAMVGDGINDAPALTRADMGIAIGAGADVAIDAADVVLMNSRLTDVPAAIRLSRAALRNIHENLFWAFIYNVIGIPLAAGAFISLLCRNLNPMFRAAAMSLSSFCVCMNALRLNLVKLGGGKSAEKTNEGTKAEVKTAPNVEIELKTAEGEQAEKKTSDRAKENDKMTKTIYITGMMCGHCEATVKKALEALSGVDAAEVSHEAGTAVVTLSADISDEVLTKAVTDKDYEVTDIK